MKVRFNPLLIKSLNFRKRSFLKKQNPSWFGALSTFPPPAKASNFVISGSSSQFRASETLLNASKRQEFNARRLTRNPKNVDPKYTTKPPRIVYEEDEIRDAFFKQHPYELTRPKSMDVDYEGVVWDRIEGTPKQEVCGECVVQRTLYLYKRNTDSLNTAYQQALAEFHKSRREQEEQQLQEQRHAYTTGLERWREEMRERKIIDPDFVIPKEPDYFFGRESTAKFMEKERLELAEGLQYRKSLLETFEATNDNFPSRDFSSLSSAEEGKRAARVE